MTTPRWTGDDDDWVCPDGGRCHHGCSRAWCYRVCNASPLSGVYDGDEWPVRVQLALGREAAP